MVSLTKKKIKGRTYWYAVESKRVNGKPRVVWQLYLGTAEHVMDVFKGAESGMPAKLRSFPYGKHAALFDVNESLGFTGVVDEHAKLERLHGLTVGEYMLLLIMGRCDGPVSKNGMEDWFRNSSMNLLWSFDHSLSSQNFLNHMKRLDEVRDDVEEDLARIILGKGIKPSILLWDRTNYYTFIEHGGKLPRKGHSKHHRNDKNLIDLGLVTGEDGMPFLHTVDEASLPDAKSFPVMLNLLVDRLKKLGLNKKEIESMSIVFDKGNNSKPNISAVAGHMHVVGSVQHKQVKDLMDIPLESYEFLYENAKKHKVYGYRTERSLFGIDAIVVVSYNDGTEKRQRMTYERDRKAALEKLSALKTKLESVKKTKGRRPTRSGLERAVNDIIPKRLRAVITYTIAENKSVLSGFSLGYAVNEEAESFRRSTFGKTVVFTDNNKLSSKKIVRTYNSKYVVENNFRWFNDTALLPMKPFFVRNDVPITAHVFLCVTGMLFYRYLFWKLKSFKLSGEQILKELDGIRIALASKGDGKKAEFVFEEMTPLQARIFSFLDLGRFAGKKE